MKLVVCSLFDRGVQAYGRPMFVSHINQAVRSLTDETNNPESELNKHPDDYDLYELGEFDDSHARFVLYDDPKFVCAVKSLLKVS